MVCTTPFSKVASVALVAVRKTQHAVMVIAQALAKTTEGGWFFIDESSLAASSKILASTSACPAFNSSA